MAATCVFLGIVLGSLSIIQISDVLEQNNEKILLEKVDALYLKANAKLDMMAGFVDLYAKFAYREITDVKALISSEEYFKNYKRRMEIALRAMTSSAMHPKTLYYKFGRVHWPREGLFIVRNGQTYIDHEITDLSLYAEDDIEHVGWYHLPVKNGAPTWMAPYDNANIDNARIISYVIPVIVNSEEIGVTGIDYDLNEITDVAAAANLAESSYGEAFVISKEGRVYYHPTLSYGSFISSEIEDIEDILKKITTQSGKYHNRVFISKNRYVSLKELENGMLIGVVVNKSTVNEAGDSLLSKLLLAAVIVLILMISATAVIAESIVQPILKLNNTARKIALNIFTEEVEVKGHDEITDLSLSIRNMKDHLHKYTEYIKSLAFIDSMTGANNKTAYDRDIQEIDLKLTSHENQVFGIAVFDVNGLKEINDNYGHESGNYLISDASDAIRAAFPKDRVYRIGGDEFAAVLKGEEEISLYESMKHNFELEVSLVNEKNCSVPDKPYTLEIALGFAAYDIRDHQCVRDVFKTADSRMYENKMAMKSKSINQVEK